MRKAVNGNQADCNDNQKDQTAEQDGQVGRAADFAGIHFEDDLVVGWRQGALGPQFIFGVVLADGQKDGVFVDQFYGVRQLGVGKLFFLSHVVQVNRLVYYETLHNRKHADVNRTEEHDVVRRHSNLEIGNVDVRVAAGKYGDVRSNSCVVLRSFGHVGKSFFFRGQFYTCRNLQVRDFVV